MKAYQLAAAACALSLAACGDAEQDAEQILGTAESEAVVALGMTERQLLDADVLDASGAEIGDVEQLVRSPDGQVSHLLIEVEDGSPDRFVQLPLDGLQMVQQGDDREIGSTLTRDGLMAMPEVAR